MKGILSTALAVRTLLVLRARKSFLSSLFGGVVISG